MTSRAQTSTLFFSTLSLSLFPTLRSRGQRGTGGLNLTHTARSISNLKPCSPLLVAVGVYLNQQLRPALPVVFPLLHILSHIIFWPPRPRECLGLISHVSEHGKYRVENFSGSPSQYSQQERTNWVQGPRVSSCFCLLWTWSWSSPSTCPPGAGTGLGSTWLCCLVWARPWVWIPRGRAPRVQSCDMEHWCKESGRGDVEIRMSLELWAAILHEPLKGGDLQ